MNQTPPMNPDQVGRVSQIIVGSLIMGMVSFGSIAVASRQKGAAELGAVSCLVAGIAGLMIVVSFVLSQTSTSRAVERIAAEKPDEWRATLAPVYLTKFILANAPLEGAGLFNGVAYIIDGHWMNLAVMLGLVSLMAIMFPSQTQFETWAAQVQRDHAQ